MTQGIGRELSKGIALNPNNTDKAVSKMSNADDSEYLGYVARFKRRFTDTVLQPAGVMGAVKPLFMVALPEGYAWATFLQSLPVEQRQYHNCRHCQFFFDRYAGLVTLENGVAKSAIWNEEDALPMYKTFARHMNEMLEGAQVDSVFFHDEALIGHPVTEDKWGKWHHFGLDMPHSARNFSRTEDAGQLTAKKAEDFKNIVRAVEMYGLERLQQVNALLQADKLYRSEKVQGPAGFLLSLAAARNNAKNRTVRHNITYQMIAQAPDGFLHPRSSMIGTLLDDLEAGKSVDQAMAAFARKMAPTIYQRPQAMPAAGAIKAAEEKLQALGAARSLERRFARLDEVVTMWRPRPEAAPAAPGGVFGHLMAKEPNTIRSDSVSTMTFEKFRQTVLPKAVAIQVMAPSHGNYIGTLTAVHQDAPPILRWDSEQARNPFSTYVYTGGSSPAKWGIRAGWIDCLGVMQDPAHWYGESTMDAKSAVLVLKGAMDGNLSGSAIFPETLKADFHSMRSVIEAHSGRRPVAPGVEQGACGLNAVGTILRAELEGGVVLTYKIDRWD